MLLTQQTLLASRNKQQRERPGHCSHALVVTACLDLLKNLQCLFRSASTRWAAVGEKVQGAVESFMSDDVAHKTCILQLCYILTLTDGGKENTKRNPTTILPYHTISYYKPAASKQVIKH